MRNLITYGVCLAAAAMLLLGCTNLFSSDSSDSSENGDTTSDGELTIQGQLHGLSGLSGQSVEAQQQEADWVVVALSWSHGFEPPDLFAGLAGEADSGFELTFWEDAEVIDLGSDGTFSYSPPVDGGFVLFAVDLEDDGDPVKGLIGVGTGEEGLVWQAMDTEFLTGTVDLGTIAQNNGLIWGSDTTVQQLEAGGALTDSESVLQLAYFDDGVRMLKNHLNVGYDISRGGLAERAYKPVVVVMYAGGEAETEYDELKAGFEPGDLEREEGYMLAVVVQGNPTIELKPPEEISWDHEDESQSLTDFKEIELYDEEGSGIYSGGFRFYEDEDDDMGRFIPLDEHFSANWTIKVNDDEYEINLDSALTADDLTGEQSPFPVPRIDVNVDDADLLESIEVEWFQMDGGVAPGQLSQSVRERLIGTFQVKLNDEDAEEDGIKYQEQLYPDAGESAVTVVEPDKGWKLDPEHTQGDDDEEPFRLTDISLTVSLKMTHVVLDYGWGYYDEDDD